MVWSFWSLYQFCFSMVSCIFITWF